MMFCEADFANSFQAVSDASLDGIITIDVKGSIVSVNPAAERLFGAVKADLLGRNVSCLMPAPHAEHHDSYLRNFVHTGVKNVIGRGREVQAHRVDTHEVFWIHLSVVELVGECRWFTGFVRDISETKRAQHQAEVSRQKFSGIFESSIDALVCATTDGTITDVNATTVNMFGYASKEELVGLNVSILTPPEHRQMHPLYMQNYLRTGIGKIMGSTQELRACRKDGSLFPIELPLSEIQTELVHGFIGSVREKRNASMPCS
jgi:two-component system sensor kinase FixL